MRAVVSRIIYNILARQIRTIDYSKYVMYDYYCAVALNKYNVAVGRREKNLDTNENNEMWSENTRSLNAKRKK